MESLETLRIDDREDRMVVWLSRPQARNAIDPQTVRDLHTVCERLEESPKPMLITSGEGYFASGADLRSLIDHGKRQALAARTRTVFDRINALPMPTVAAVDGYAYGGGAELTYACDLRIASDRAVFGNPETGLGITAGAGGCWRLPDLVGPTLARLMLFTGYTLTAAEALRAGLVVDVVPPDRLLDTAHALIDRMCSRSALALQVTKLVLGADSAHPATDTLAQALLFEDEEKQQRMTAFLESRRRRSS